jgi:hypothetical protein
MSGSQMSRWVHVRHGVDLRTHFLSFTEYGPWKTIRKNRHELRRARDELDRYSFVQGYSIYRRMTTTLSLLLVTLGIVLLLVWMLIPDPDFASIVTGFIALIAIILGGEQWQASRDEITLDRFYDRIEITNRMLDECKCTRGFAGPWPDEKGKDDEERYQRSMYVYRELDNLEYAIAKYKIGFMSPFNALRCLRTFRARCMESSDFCELVKAILDPADANPAGYDQATVAVARKCVEHAMGRHA